MRKSTGCYACLMLLSLSCLPACGRSASGPASGGPSSAESGSEAPTAESVVRRVADFYKQAEAARVDVHQTMKLSRDGQNNELTQSMAATVARPNRFALRDASGQNVEMVSDGKTLFTQVPQLNTYTEAAAPASLNDAANDPLNGVMVGMGTMFAMSLFADDPYASIMEGVSSSTYVGEEALDGQATIHLKFQQAQFDWDLWVAKDGDPLVRKAVFDLARQLGDAFAGDSETSVTSTVAFSNWQLNPSLPADAFAFAPLPGARRVDNLLAGNADDEPAADPGAALVGKPAPQIEAKTLNGAPFSLSEQTANQFVMLDFWATWCPPCVQEMPILAKVAQDYADRGVALFAVNLAENAPEVRSFLENKKLNVNVVMDETGAVAAAYGVQSIPMLVIVDKQGVVQRVHTGYRQDIEQILRGELDALLAGRSLSE